MNSGWRKEVGSVATLRESISSYLGRPDPDASGDIDLTEAFLRGNRQWMARTIHRMSETKDRGGRVFVIGNGGSYDNARLIAKLLRRAGVSAEVPGTDEQYRQDTRSTGFSSIYRNALEQAGFGESDLLVALSGSGNSPNILEAMAFAGNRNGAVIGLSGRDGGRMMSLVGDGRMFIAATECMEALEDVHPLVMAVVAACMDDTGIDGELESGIGKVVSDVLEPLKRPRTLDDLASLAARIETAIFHRGRIFILGDPVVHPAVTHMDADWGRGLINQLPVAGPERITYANTNAWMATGNDDGADFWLIDEFARTEVGGSDVVIVFGAYSGVRPIDLCLDHLESTGVVPFVFGDIAGPRVIPAREHLLDLLATVVIHAVSRCVHDHIISETGIGWRVAAADIAVWPKEVQVRMKEMMKDSRKLDRTQTLSLESDLRRESLLGREEVLTWCYGTPYVVDDPAVFGLPRAFY